MPAADGGEEVGVKWMVSLGVESGEPGAHLGVLVGGAD
jgi:hypothetical protein